MGKLTLGEIAFNAYALKRGGIAYDGTPIPAWPHVAPGVQEAWAAAAAAVEAEVLFWSEARKAFTENG